MEHELKRKRGESNTDRWQTSSRKEKKIPRDELLADMTLQVAWMEEGGNVRSRFRKQQGPQEAAGEGEMSRSRNQWPSDSLPPAKP